MCSGILDYSSSRKATLSLKDEGGGKQPCSLCSRTSPKGSMAVRSDDCGGHGMCLTLSWAFMKSLMISWGHYHPRIWEHHEGAVVTVQYRLHLTLWNGIIFLGSYMDQMTPTRPIPYISLGIPFPIAEGSGFVPFIWGHACLPWIVVETLLCAAQNVCLFCCRFSFISVVILRPFFGI